MKNNLLLSCCTINCFIAFNLLTCKAPGCITIVSIAYKMNIRVSTITFAC